MNGFFYYLIDIYNMEKYSYLKYFKSKSPITKSTQNSHFKTNQSQETNVFMNDSQLQNDKLPQNSMSKQIIEPPQQYQQKQNYYSPKSKNRKQSVKRDSTQTKWLQYQNQKILPHVSEIFNYKITNYLLSNKIKNPKRDKLITFSFHSPSKQINQTKKKTQKSLHSKLSNEKKIKPQNNRASTTKKYIGKNRSTFFADLSSPCINYNDAYTISLQNQRMGKRIFNARSMVDQYLHSTYFTYHLYNGKITNKSKFDTKQSKDKTVAMKKLNNGLKVFFNPVNDNAEKKIYKNKYEDQDQSEIWNQSDEKMDQNEEIIKLEDLNRQNSILNQNKQNTNDDTDSIKKCTRSTDFRTKTCKSKKRDKQNDTQNSQCPFGNRLNTSYQLRKKLAFKSEPDKQLAQLLSHNYQSHNAYDSDIFGKGPTILALRNFQIQSNPKLKEEDLIILELLESPYNCRINNSKGVSTNPIAYRDIHKQVKFAVNTHIGDFIPLRIWKYNGITSIQIGVLDINLKPFKNKKCPQMNLQIIKQQKDSLTRDIVIAPCEGRLRRRKRRQIGVKVKFECLFYDKKFNKISKGEKQN